MALETQADFYLNFNHLSEMKLGARNNSADARESVAQQFESLFIQQMLSAMRSAAKVDEGSHSSYLDNYQEMHDKQLALTMAKQGGFGLAKFILQQMPGGQEDSGKGGESLPLHHWQEVKQATTITKMPEYQAENPAVVVNQLHHEDIEADAIVGIGRSDNKPSTFVSEIWPGAQKASKTLGISAEALVAQSVLETGWGKHMMRRPDGSSAFNLFGIKADSRWQGPTVTKPTLEFRDGVMQTEIAHFRAYDSPAESLEDYVDFIQSSARYQNALEHGGNDALYLRGLQKAGYATDPNYADKILSIIEGEHLQKTLASLPADIDKNLNGETRNA